MRIMLDQFTMQIIFFAAAGLILFVAFIIFMVLYVSSKKREHKYDDALLDATSSVRVFVIDAKSNTVRFFNRSKLKTVHSVSIIGFYNQFVDKDRIKVVEWVQQLLDPENKTTNDFLEVSVIEKRRDNKKCFSILHAQKIDKKNQLIHVESYLLRLKDRRKVNLSRVSKFINRGKMDDIIKSSNGRKGVVLAINFYNKQIEKRNTPVSRLIFAQIRNTLLNYITTSRPINEHSDHEIIIADMGLQTKSQTLNFIAIIKNEINRILSINSQIDDIGYSIGVADHKHFSKNPTELINTAVNLASIAMEDGMEILWYEPGKDLSRKESEDDYRSEIEKIIIDKKLRFEYRPIYNADSNRLLGYQAFITPKDSIFDSIDELKDYSFRTGDDKELFSTIARNSISTFIQEKDGVNLRLFFPISYMERHYVNRTLANISKIKETHIVLQISEKDIEDLKDNELEEVIETLRSFKSKGYEVALYLNDRSLTSSPALYSLFDFFMVPYLPEEAENSQQRWLLSLNGLVEKLLHYQEPIIAVDIPNWDSIELFLKLGLNILSSEVISPRSEMVLPIPQKSLTKIKHLANK